MGDIGDYWRDHKDYAKKKKAKFRSNWDLAVKRLERAGIEYYELSEEHYRISLTNDFIDWWPSTGTWRSKDGKKSGHGVGDLIREVKRRGDL